MLEYELVLKMQGVPFKRVRYGEAPPEFYLMDTLLHRLRFTRTTSRYEKDGVVYWHYEWDCKPYNDSVLY